MVSEALASGTNRECKSLRAEFVAELAAALKVEPETFKQTNPSSMMGSVVRGLVIEAQKGRASAIKQIFQLLELAEREANPKDADREPAAAKRTASQKAPTEAPSSGRVREAEASFREKLTGLEAATGEHARPEMSAVGDPVDLETARRVVDSLRAQKCDSPTQEELRRRFLRLAEAELEEHEQRAADPSKKEQKGNNNQKGDYPGLD